MTNPSETHLNQALRLWDQYLVYGDVKDLKEACKEMENYRGKGGTLHRETAGQMKAHLKIGGWKTNP
jgi:hypothetical protein